MDSFCLWLESDMDFPLAHWRQAVDYFQDDPTEERLKWLGNWLYENTYYFQKLGDKYFEFEGEDGQFPDGGTPQSHFFKCHSHCRGVHGWLRMGCN